MDGLDRYQRRMSMVLLVGLTVLFLVLGGRIVYINTVHRDHLLATAERQRASRRVLPARRGMIMDRAGRVVAATRQMPDVFVDPFGAADLEALAGAIAPRLNVSTKDILEKIRRRPGSRYVVLARRVDAVTADAVRDMKNPHVGLTDTSVRHYPHGRSMAHVIGFVNRDGAGIEGIELSLDSQLRGTDGARETIRDARRRALLQSPEATTPPLDGGHVVLTIDSEIQRIVEEALAEQVDAFEAKCGLAIAMDIASGQILALANHPTFDLNHPMTDAVTGNPVSADVRRNRAITDPIEPGSTIKLVIASGALDGGFVNLEEKIDCNNGRPYRFPGRTLTDSHACGVINLTDIITHSSNIGMGKIALRMGPPVLHETLTRFGLGKPCGIELPGEGRGVISPVRRWSKLTPTSVAIGYEFSVTPLQLLNAYAASLNDGVQLRPKLVKAILAPDGQVVSSFDEPEPLRRVSSIDTARYMSREALVSVVENGNVRKALDGPYQVLGKTGTARLVRADRSGYEKGAYLSLFVGAAPVFNPQVVTVVVVRRPNASLGYYGATVAAPAAGKILAQTLAYLGVEPQHRLASSR
jgi:cell division protein FtsI (penicillin-binding protein 3)